MKYEFLSTTHSFNIHDAKKYGINCAIVLNNIEYWVKYNSANGINYFEGKYWTYNSVKAYTHLFPYLSVKQIKLAIKKLEDCGILETGKFNDSIYDQTKWYTLTDEYIFSKGNFEPKKVEEKEIETVKKSKTSDFNLKFEEFWNEYPRKENKKGASDKLKRLLKEDKTLFEVIMQGLQLAKKSDQWKETRFIPHAQTWLNREGWNDKPTEFTNKETVTSWYKTQDVVPEQEVNHSEIDEATAKLKARLGG